MSSDERYAGHNHLALAAQFVERKKWMDLGPEMERVFKDAERWAYVRDELVRGVGPHMDGTFVWCVRSLPRRATTFTEAIDNLIRESRERRCTDFSECTPEEAIRQDKGNR